MGTEVSSPEGGRHSPSGGGSAADRSPPPLRRSNSTPTPDLHRHLTLWERRGADPFEYYEALEVIGFGSMGSITRVRKRAERAGGSARGHNLDPCADCLNHPWFGGLARILVKAKGECDALVEPCRDGGVARERRRKGSRGEFKVGSTSYAPATALGSPALGAAAARESATAAAARSAEQRRRKHRQHNGERERFPGNNSSGRASNNSSGRAGQRKSKRALFESLSSMTSGGSTRGSKNGFGKMVRLSDRNHQLTHFALKSIHLSRVRHTTAEFLEELRNEVAILRSLDHPFVVRAIETFEHRRQMYVVMELCTGGDLYTRDPYTEEEASRIARMVLSAVRYMHERNIVHRDLKYENIMFASSHPQSEVKIIDFGLSKKYGPKDQYMSEGVGTIYTMAPQVLEGKYTSACDLWSIGVITYALLSSQVPFFSSKRRKLIEKIKKGKYDFRGRRWAMISQQAKEFVADLLQVDPDIRSTAEEARKSLWLNRSFAVTLHLSDDMKEDVRASISNFSNYSQLQKLALMVVAHKSSSEEIGFLRKAFQKYDTNTEGRIGRKEFWECLVDYGYSQEELDRMFEAVDIDSTGYIQYTEFLAATIEVHGAINEERLAEAFDRLDCDDSGYISMENLRSILGDEIPQSDIDRIIQEAAHVKKGGGGKDDGSKISYDEFLSLWDVDQERQREDALRSVTAHRAAESSASVSTFMGSSGEISPISPGPSTGSGAMDSSSPYSQIDLSVASSFVGYSGLDRRRLSMRETRVVAAHHSAISTMLSPSVQPTEAPVDPGHRAI